MSMEPWKEAMKEEMWTLEKKHYMEDGESTKWEKEQLDADGFLLSNIELMVHWRGTRWDL